MARSLALVLALGLMPLPLGAQEVLRGGGALNSGNQAFGRSQARTNQEAPAERNLVEQHMELRRKNREEAQRQLQALRQEMAQRFGRHARSEAEERATVEAFAKSLGLTGEAERALTQILDQGLTSSAAPGDLEGADAMGQLRAAALRQAASFGAVAQEVQPMPKPEVTEVDPESPAGQAERLFAELGRRAQGQTPYEVTLAAAERAMPQAAEQLATASGVELRQEALSAQARALFEAHSSESPEEARQEVATAGMLEGAAEALSIAAEATLAAGETPPSEIDAEAPKSGFSFSKLLRFLK